jgi:hypothetical protein
MLQRHWRRKRAVGRRKGKVIIVGGREICQLVSLSYQKEEEGEEGSAHLSSSRFIGLSHLDLPTSRIR